jgi:MoaA/NifB/PqqE/SkfB family radical SAM enzyme
MTAPVVSLRASDDRTCRFRRMAGDRTRCALEVMHRCNLAWPHCFVPRDREEPPAGELLPILRQLAGVRCRKVILSGGEPLVRLDLESLIGACGGRASWWT